MDALWLTWATENKKVFRKINRFTFFLLGQQLGTLNKEYYEIIFLLKKESCLVCINTETISHIPLTAELRCGLVYPLQKWWREVWTLPEFGSIYYQGPRVPQGWYCQSWSDEIAVVHGLAPQDRGESPGCWKQWWFSGWVVQLFVTLWTIACQASLSMGFSRQEYWSGLPCPSPGDLFHPGIKPGSPALQADSLPPEPPGKPSRCSNIQEKSNVEESCPCKKVEKCLPGQKRYSSFKYTGELLGPGFSQLFGLLKESLLILENLYEYNHCEALG